MLAYCFLSELLTFDCLPKSYENFDINRKNSMEYITREHLGMSEIQFYFVSKIL